VDRPLLFDVRGARRVHRQPVRGAQLAVAGLGVDADDLVVLHQQAPDRHGHQQLWPAWLWMRESCPLSQQIAISS
jgi:hypothetical protein